MKATLYKQPFGRTQEIDISEIDDSDAEWLEANGVKISLEEIGGVFVVYGDIGHKTEDGEPDEIVEISQGRTCRQVMAALRQACEKAKGDLNG